jgi:hypothetical protein
MDNLVIGIAMATVGFTIWSLLWIRAMERNRPKLLTELIEFQHLNNTPPEASSSTKRYRYAK